MTVIVVGYLVFGSDEALVKYILKEYKYELLKWASLVKLCDSTKTPEELLREEMEQGIYNGVEYILNREVFITELME